MQTYQVEYKKLDHWSDWRWYLLEATDDEEAAWSAKNWTVENGCTLIDVKRITGEP
tara:strand:- start:2063 stop:2230 length:168 start_codon:yes stop_codon:yes gene_type:complete